MKAKKIENGKDVGHVLKKAIAKYEKGKKVQNKHR